MKVSVKLSVLALLTSCALLLPASASAVSFYCSFFCDPTQSCQVQCVNDFTGVFTNCGNYGCCTTKRTNCNAQSASATPADARCTAAQTMETAGDEQPPADLSFLAQ